MIAFKYDLDDSLKLKSPWQEAWDRIAYRCHETVAQLDASGLTDHTKLSQEEKNALLFLSGTRWDVSYDEKEGRLKLTWPDEYGFMHVNGKWQVAVRKLPK